MAMLRIVWGGLGGLSAGLGAAGVVLPLLPTTPFMLLAAFCFARSSPRLERWMIEHPRFGPAIRDWRDQGAISARSKAVALVAITVTFGISLALGLEAPVLVVQGVVLLLVCLFILTRPSGSAKPEP